MITTRGGVALNHAVVCVLSIILCGASVPTFSNAILTETSAPARQTAKFRSRRFSDQERPTVLRSSEQLLRGRLTIKDMVADPSAAKRSIYILGTDRRVYIYDSTRSLRSFATFMESPDSIAVDFSGRVFVGDYGVGRVSIFGRKGSLLKALSISSPSSIAALRNGGFVVASVSQGTVLRVFNSDGDEVGTYGRERRFLVGADAENRFLNRGKVVADASDTIFYIYTHAPVPFVQSFSRTGQPQSEFILEGEAVDLQLSVAQQFLRNRRDMAIGGVRIVNSAAVDPNSGLLCICLNGLSNSGVCYTYKPDGIKMSEYSLHINQVNAGSIGSSALTSVTNVVLRGGALHANAPQGLFPFDLNKLASESEVFQADETAGCPVAVEFPECTTPCGTTDKADDKDCKAELLASVTLNGQRIVHQNCTTTSTTCSSSITLCKEANGVESTHSIDLQCGTIGSGGGGPTFCAPQSCGVGEAFGCFWDSAICDCECSPLILDTLGNGLSLTDVRGGVNFDLMNTGRPARMAWTEVGSDDAFLVLDRNGNGRIDNGSELFGSFTPQPPTDQPNGFKALTEYDKPENGGNLDGLIDSRDAIFSSLRLWQDRNHNGISETNELHTLASLGVLRISLDYRESRVRDRNGNWFRYRARTLDTPGTGPTRWIWDVYLLTQR